MSYFGGSDDGAGGGGGEGGGGGGTPAISHADLVKANSLLVTARDKALDALNDPDCARLFLGSDGRPARDPVSGGTLDPQTVLKALTNSYLNGAGGQSWGSLGFDKLGENQGTTTGVGLRFNLFGPYYQAVKIKLDLDYWNMGFPRTNTTLLLHELGHAINYLAAGFGTINSFLDDRWSDLVSRNNTWMVEDNCTRKMNW